MKIYAILYWTDGTGTVNLVIPKSENLGLGYPEDVMNRIDTDLYTAKAQLEAIGINCALIDQQIQNEKNSGTF